MRGKVSYVVGVEHKLRPSIGPNKKDTFSYGIPCTVSLVQYPSYLNNYNAVVQSRLGLRILSRVRERQYIAIVRGRRWLKSCIQVFGLLHFLHEW